VSVKTIGLYSVTDRAKPIYKGELMSIDNTRAAYRILSPNGFFGPDDHLYMVDSDGNYPEIYFDGIPNEDMEPLNDLGRARYVAEMERLDNLGREAAAKAGRAYSGRPRDLDGAIVVASAIAREDMKIQGVRKDVASIETITPSATPETGRQNPRKRGRPAKASLLINAA
jgi:hypothetical protein